MPVPTWSCCTIISRWDPAVHLKIHSCALTNLSHFEILDTSLAPELFSGSWCHLIWEHLLPTWFRSVEMALESVCWPVEAPQSHRRHSGKISAKRPTPVLLHSQNSRRGTRIVTSIYLHALADLYCNWAWLRSEESPRGHNQDSLTKQNKPGEKKRQNPDEILLRKWGRLGFRRLRGI